MASSDDELLGEARIQTGYSTRTLDDSEFLGVLSIAKRHIRTRKAIEEVWSEDDWYANQYREEALFWFTCLFSKVATGELDSQTLQVGAVDAKSLLAKENDDVTTWFRNARTALKSVEPGENTESGFGHGIGGVSREDRLYGDEGDYGIRGSSEGNADGL
ncbi:hypothetical protein [Halomonas sp.]|uniref:hypothetical protein n=1 Tax=Halomonas sp. TaxID=1486246 RepID=UPI00356A8ABE